MIDESKRTPLTDFQQQVDDFFRTPGIIKKIGQRFDRARRSIERQKKARKVRLETLHIRTTI